jgi:hypothetical protein
MDSAVRSSNWEMTMSTTYQAAASKFGTVSHEGRTLALTQQAYADNYGTDGGVRYRATAMDDDSNEYRVEWATTPEWDAAQAAYRADPDCVAHQGDESEACDWANPVAITSI